MTEAGGLRADAVRNRGLLLHAAAAEFAEHGMDASMAAIAARAGVGKGTVFRHFPTKERLVTAIFCAQLDHLAGVGEDLLAAPDPGAALLEFMDAAVRRQAEDRSFCDAVGGGWLGGDPEVRAASARLNELAERLTARARDAGVVRGDVTGLDVMMLLAAACQAAARVSGTAPELWRRYLALIFDGLRPEGARPLPHPAPTARQYEAMGAGE